MANTAHVEGDDAPSSRASFIRSRLASWLAIAPLGVWAVAHVWGNLSAFRGEQAWTETVTTYAHPISFAITMIVVLLPLLIHSVWGIGRLFMSRPNVVRYPFYTNFKFILQRLAAVGVLFFLGAHLWLALISPRVIQGHAERFTDFAHEMRHHTPTLVVYVLGTLGVAYHLANGVQTLAFSSGFVKSQQAQRRFEVWVLAFFLIFLAMCWAAIYALWSAGA
jgi:succinate dehydrogenase / fumarate reductase cytochrome b subunit